MGHGRENIIEGIGDELIYGLAGCIIGIVPFAAMIYTWQQSRSSQEIHPDSQETVQGARDRLREQNRLPANRISERRERENGELTCPICISTATYAVETNCGHVFCGNCMITYWRHGRWIGAVRCPVCRQTVNILLFCFSEEEQHEQTEDRNAIFREINLYNRRFSGEPRTIMEYLTDLPTLIRHCLSEVFSLSGLVWMFRMRVIVCFLAALIYFLSPLDIIPEAVFGLLGFLDDFFVLLLLTIYVSILYRRFVASRAGDAE